MTRDRMGGLLVAAASILWGFSGTVAKYLFNQSVAPWVLVEIRLTLSAALLGLALVLWDKSYFRIKRADLVAFVVLGVSLAMVQFTYYLAISLTSVATEVFLQSLSPLVIVAYETVIIRQALTVRKLISLLLAVGGVAMIILGRGTWLAAGGLGVVVGLLSAVFAAFYSLYSKHRLSGDYRPWTVLFYGLCFGALFWWIVLPPTKVFHLGYSAAQMSFFLYIAILATVLPWGFFFKGLALTSASKAGIINVLEPVVATTTAAVLLGEGFNLVQAVGGILALLGVLIGGISALSGGAIDNFLMRLTDVMLSIPTLPLLMVAVGLGLFLLNRRTLAGWIIGGIGVIFFVVNFVIYFYPDFEAWSQLVGPIILIIVGVLFLYRYHHSGEEPKS